MKIKKCAAGAGTPNSAIALRCGSSSCLDEIISSFIPHGKDNAVRMSELAAARKRSISGLKSLKAAKRKLEEFKGQQFLNGLSNGKT
jgi:hypothetical protein